ncbi:integral membrane protein [Colletotrichum karsti]|uniref:Integral membrane protein n=1 Tax=Colletotrichum karsti TaxID=1095194 RepID=A0A9P6I2E5_9PEZI|nr:uncharacterized protein CkaCkLH20_11772 [Colletotrichum karsti]KAF9870670.1 integral membrane protein [Colletotrichum karsti]
MPEATEPGSPSTADAGSTVYFPIERESQISVLATSIAFIVLSTTAVILRMVARRMARRTLDASDYCIIAACVCANGLQSIGIVGVIQCGVGYHFQEIIAMFGMAPITKFLKMLIGVQILWATSLSLCKISILILYTKIFSVRIMIMASKMTAALIIVWALTTILLGFFICRPFALNWEPTLDGSCGNQVLSYLVTGTLNLVTDLIVLVLPLSYLWNLHLRLYKKLVLIATFSMGIFTCVISAMRLVSLTSLDYNDITFNIPHALIFGSLEPSVGVIVACVPLLRPLLGRSQYSSTGTARYPERTTNDNSRLRAATGPQKQGFTMMDDGSSQHELRTVAPENGTASSINTKGSDGVSGLDGERL